MNGIIYLVDEASGYYEFDEEEWRHAKEEVRRKYTNYRHTFEYSSKMHEIFRVSE